MRNVDHLAVERQRPRVRRRRDGYLGRMAIHPDQVAVINACYGASEAEIAFARRVVAAFAVAFRMHGSSITPRLGCFAALATTRGQIDASNFLAAFRCGMSIILPSSANAPAPGVASKASTTRRANKISASLAP